MEESLRFCFHRRNDDLSVYNCNLEILTGGGNLNLRRGKIVQCTALCDRIYQLPHFLIGEVLELANVTGIDAFEPTETFNLNVSRFLVKTNQIENQLDAAELLEFDLVAFYEARERGSNRKCGLCQSIESVAIKYQAKSALKHLAG